MTFHTPDLINGLYESTGGFIMIINIIKIIKDKQIKGFHWFPVAFFSSWSVFNLYYYPHLNQILSTIGAIIMALSNVLYAYLVIYYTIKNRKHKI